MSNDINDKEMDYVIKVSDDEYEIKTRCKPTHVELFERLAASPDSERPVQTAGLILCTPRCGSTLFCEALNETGALGIAEEWLNYEYFVAWQQVVGASLFNLKKYCEWVFNKSSRNTGVWMLKWHVGQLIAMNQDFHLGIESMDFARIIYLYRRDKIAQAVSMVKAVTTDCFRSTEEENSDNYNMNRAIIGSAINNLCKFDHFARTYLKQYIDTMAAYEDFKNPEHPLYNEVMGFFGKPLRKSFPVTTVKRQADHRNVAAVRDFRSYILGEIE